MNSKDYHNTKAQILEYLRKQELYQEFCDDINKDIDIFQKSIDMFTGQVDKDLVCQFIQSLRNIQRYYDCEIKRNEYENL